MEYFKTLSGASKFHSFNSNISIQLWQVPQSFPESALRELEEGWEAVRQRRGVLAQGVVSTENAILFSYPSQDNLLTYKDDSSEAFYLSVEDQVAARMDFVDRYMLSQQKGHYCLIHIKSLKADFVVCAKWALNHVIPAQRIFSGIPGGADKRLNELIDLFLLPIGSREALAIDEQYKHQEERYLRMGSSELRKAFVIFPKAILLNPAYQRVIWQTQKGVPVYKAVLNAAARIPLQMVVDTHHEFTEPDLEKYTGNVSRLDADLERLKNVKPALLLSPEAKQL